MAQVKVLKIGALGLPTEHAATDDLSLASFTASATVSVTSGPSMSTSGIDMNSTALSEITSASFSDPSTGTINQTAGNVTIDNLMAKERSNVMTTAGGVAFPVIADSAGEVDSFRLPALAGTPTATPTNGGAGHLVYDSSNGKLYAYTGAAWDDLSTVSTANSIDNTFTAAGAISARDLVYISAADSVTIADADSDAASQVIGFATAAALDTASVTVRSQGVLTGFTGLTAGAKYYLSATAGAYTATIPTGAGNNVIQVGYAKSTTAMWVQVQALGRRAA